MRPAAGLLVRLGGLRCVVCARAELHPSGPSAPMGPHPYPDRVCGRHTALRAPFRPQPYECSPGENCDNPAVHCVCPQARAVAGKKGAACVQREAAPRFSGAGRRRWNVWSGRKVKGHKPAAGGAASPVHCRARSASCRRTSSLAAPASPSSRVGSPSRGSGRLGTTQSPGMRCARSCRCVCALTGPAQPALGALCVAALRLPSPPSLAPARCAARCHRRHCRQEARPSPAANKSPGH